jgi:hypothetical protein
MHEVPDIRLHYEWQEGALPPPHHYEYRLEVRGDEGRIDFSPDYPGAGKPRWVETFVVDPHLVTRIVARLDHEGLLRKVWELEDGRAPAGGSLDSLEIDVDDVRYTIPSWVARENDRTREIIVEIRSLVPEPLWDELIRRRREYEDDWGE